MGAGHNVIGTTSGAVINLTNDNISIIGQSLSFTANDVNVNASNVSLGSNTTIDGKPFLAHTHSKGQDGQPTGGVI